MAPLIVRLKQIAQDNYAKGGDVFVECYDESDWVAFSGGKTDAEAEAMLHTLMGVYYDREQTAEHLWKW